MARWTPNRPQRDRVFTSPDFARRVVQHFNPTGLVLDPCRGNSAFYDALPSPKDWCEISEGRDFLQWTTPVDWVMTNPGWSKTVYVPLARHAFSLARNVVFLIRLHNALGAALRHRIFRYHGHGIRQIILVDWEEAGFPSEGFCLCVVHWQRGWEAGTKWTYWN